MACDTRMLKGQTLTQRKLEIKESIDRLSTLLVTGKVKALVGPQGAVAFQGWAEEDRGRVSDSCAFRRIMATGSSLAKAAIARAEQMSGRNVNRQAVAQGWHTHGGDTWHKH